MDAGDPRHGTARGRSQHMRDGERPCAGCAWAHSRENKRRQLSDQQPKVSTVGTHRRIRALQAIGYGKRRIAREMGYRNEGSISYLMQSDTMLAATAAKVAAVYDRLSMVVPLGHVADRTRAWASRSGFPPPLAWDDIDDPDEVPAATYAARVPRAAARANEFDPAVVVRVLGGDWRHPATKAERFAIVAQFTGDHNDLARLTGWNVSRYITRTDGAA